MELLEIKGNQTPSLQLAQVLTGYTGLKGWVLGVPLISFHPQSLREGSLRTSTNHP